MQAPPTIYVGSCNPAKLDAVRSAVEADGRWPGVTVEGRAVPSGVAAQPLSLEETVQGALARARGAYGACAFSIGLEDGLLALPAAATGYLNVCACAIYDGKDVYIGLSSAFEYPPEVVRSILDRHLDVTQAFVAAGLSDDPALGAGQGAIGVLTRGRLTRRGYAAQAVTMALIRMPPA